MTKFFKLGLFSPKLRINKIRSLSSFNQLNSEDGFTLVEFFIVIAIIGVLITFMNPINNFITQKAREREGSLLIRSFLEASTENHLHIPGRSSCTIRHSKLDSGARDLLRLSGWLVRW